MEIGQRILRAFNKKKKNMPALPQYNSIKRCKKCGYIPESGSKRFGKLFWRPLYIPDRDEREWLVRECPECQYRWQEACQE